MLSENDPTTRRIRLNSLFKNLTTKARKAHKGKTKSKKLILRAPLCAFVVKILLLGRSSYLVVYANHSTTILRAEIVDIVKAACNNNTIDISGLPEDMQKIIKK